MRKLTKSQVIARVKRNNTLVVYLLPSKCSPLNTTWATLIQPYEIPLIMGQNGIVYSVQHGIDYEFNDLINSYRYYNCNSELGNRVHYYIEEKES